MGDKLLVTIGPKSIPGVRPASQMAAITNYCGVQFSSDNGG